MRLDSRILGLCLLLGGCSGGDGGPDAGGDAAVRDAAVAEDAGGSGPEVACGAALCQGAVEYCEEAPTAPCAPIDGGACGAGEEICNLDGVATGCTPAIPRTCRDLPPGCTNCVCLIDTAPCGPGGLAVTCSGTAQVGLTVRCPPP